MKTCRTLATALIMLLGSTVSAPVLAQSRSTTSALMDASEVFENLTEGAAQVEDAGFMKAMATFESLRPALGKSLSVEKLAALDAAVAGVRAGWRRGDRGAVALQSIEAYRVVQEALDRKGQRVPVEVALLDYAGFKSKALLLAASPDWAQAAKTAGEASRWWAAIQSRVKDETLRAAMGHAVTGLTDAASRKDAALLAFASELDLILVDGLETHFGGH